MIAEHDPARAPDVVGVAGEDALVDDVGVQRRQQERAHRLHERERDDDQQLVAVRAEMAAEEPDEVHQLLSARRHGRGSVEEERDDLLGGQRLVEDERGVGGRDREAAQDVAPPRAGRAGSGPGRARRPWRARRGREPCAAAMPRPAASRAPCAAARGRPPGAGGSRRRRPGGPGGRARGRSRPARRRRWSGRAPTRRPRRGATPCRGRPGRSSPRRCRRPRRSDGWSRPHRA